jgi:adenylosuccinate lyase
MPHKRNPVGCEQITGLARLLRANAHAALENVALWHERDISHSSVERVILPDSFIALDHMLRRFTRIVRGMVVYPDRMRENLERSRGVVFSGTVLLELARAASRASRPTNGCSATPCARSTSSGTSRRCCWTMRT